MKILRLKKTANPLPPAPIRLFMGDGSFEFASPSNPVFYRRLKSSLRHIPECWGMRLPEVEICHQSSLPPQCFRLEVQGLLLAEGQLIVGRLLALGDEECLGPLLGEADLDPIYGLPCKWVLPTQVEQARDQGCLLMEPETVLMTLLMERLPGQLHKLLTMDEVSTLLDRWSAREPKLIEETRQRFTLNQIFRLLRDLLQEKVSILRLDLALQGALRTTRKKPGPEIAELARQALGWEICQQLNDGSGALAAIVLARWLERRWIKELNGKNSIEDWFFQRFGLALELETHACWTHGRRPVLVVDAKIRADLAGLLHRLYPDLPVLSWAEIPPEVNVDTVATLGDQVHPLAYRWPSQSFEIEAEEECHLQAVSSIS